MGVKSLLCSLSHRVLIVLTLHVIVANNVYSFFSLSFSIFRNITERSHGVLLFYTRRIFNV